MKEVVHTYILVLPPHEHPGYFIYDANGPKKSFLDLSLSKKGRQVTFDDVGVYTFLFGKKEAFGFLEPALPLVDSNGSIAHPQLGFILGGFPSFQKKKNDMDPEKSESMLTP